MSVIIPVYNGRAFVADALHSVFAQTHREIECIVVDDGSTDGTADVVAAAGTPAICIRQDNQGVSAARNAGAARASGDLIAFLDADDVWQSDKVSAQIEALQHDRYPMVMCGATVVDADLRPIGARTMSLPATQPLLGMVLFGTGSVVSCSSTALVTREAFSDVGGFDTSLSMSADWDFLARFLLAYGGVAYVKRPLIAYRCHDGNMSHAIAQMEFDMLRCYRKLFGRADVPAEVASRRRAAYGSMRRMLAGSYWQAGQRQAALRNALLSLAWQPAGAIGLLRRAACLHGERSPEVR